MSFSCCWQAQAVLVGGVMRGRKEGRLALSVVFFCFVCSCFVYLLFPIVDLDVQLGHFLRQIFPHLVADAFPAVSASVVVAAVAALVPRAGRRGRRRLARRSEHGRR
jgi:hypothetical protein